MFELMLVACFWYKTFVNIDINDKCLLSNFNYTKVLIYFSNRCIANLSLVQLNTPV